MIEPWLEELETSNRIYIGFSGGLDSSVLLYQLQSIPTLKQKLTAIHVNHGISSQADAWSCHCERVCSSLQVPLILNKVVISSSNIESEARKARYAVFKKIIQKGDYLLLAHHRDDQAETILLQLMRGTGIQGMAAMWPNLSFGKGVLVRPFLDCSRATLQYYATVHNLLWIEDESNENNRFSRNFLRQVVIPSLETRWPKAKANLVRTVNHCQQANNLLQDLAVMDCPSLPTTGDKLYVRDLLHLSTDRLTNVLRFWLKFNQVDFPSTDTFKRLLNELLLARQDALPVVRWGKYCIKRYQHWLYFVDDGTVEPTTELIWHDFPKPLMIGEKRLLLSATLSSSGLRIPRNSRVKVGFRQGGEKIVWHQQTKQLKKLFQEWHIPPWERGQVPLLFIDNTLVMVVGYAIHDAFYASKGEEGVYWISNSSTATTSEP